MEINTDLYNEPLNRTIIELFNTVYKSILNSMNLGLLLRETCLEINDKGFIKFNPYVENKFLYNIGFIPKYGDNNLYYLESNCRSCEYYLDKNYRLIKKYIEYIEEKSDTKDNLVSIQNLFTDFIKETIKRYHIVIYNDEKNFDDKDIPILDLKNFTTNAYIKNTYLYYYLFKLSKFAYIEEFTFKVYSMTSDQYKNILKYGDNDIDKYNFIELGTYALDSHAKGDCNLDYNYCGNIYYQLNIFLIFNLICKILMLNKAVEEDEKIKNFIINVAKNINQLTEL